MSEAINEKAIGDITKLGGAMSLAMAALGVTWPANCDNPPRKIPYYRLRPIHFGR
jgi:hypothetical protein